MQGKRLVLMGFDGRRWEINSRQGYPGTLGSWGGGLGGKGGASPRQQQPPLTPSGCGAPGSGDEEFVSGLFSPTIWKSGGTPLVAVGYRSFPFLPAPPAAHLHRRGCGSQAWGCPGFSTETAKCGSLCH